MTNTALSPRQRQAVIHGSSPLLLSCGPGSGKTRILTERTAWLLRQGIRPGQLLVLTFSRLAAEELTDRLTALLGPDAHGIWAGTFHAFGARWLRAHARLLGRSPGFTIFDREDTRRVLRRLAQELEVKEDPAALAEALEKAKRADWDTATSLSAQPHQTLERLLPAYEALLARHDTLDFTDLLARPVGLLARHAALRDALRARFRHVLVDEGQDLYALQHRLLELFAGPSTAGPRGTPDTAPSATAALTLAADEDQAIYAWTKDADMILGKIRRCKEALGTAH